LRSSARISFFAGLLLASYFVRELAGDSLEGTEQQAFLTVIRPEVFWKSPVAFNLGCPTCSILNKPAA